MQLLFLRHGVAEPRETWTGDDGQRPLSVQGRKAMERTAAAFVELGIAPQVIVTSPLTRARQTAEIAAQGMGMSDRVVLDARLEPGFDAGALSDILSEHSDCDVVMLVGHEPDFSLIVGRLIGGGRVVCKKGGLARVDVDDGVTGGSAGSAELVWLLPPRDLTRRARAA